MRIITGLARGKRLVTPAGREVRPTPERVKEAIFSALQFEIEGRRVLDLFAGSGQLGLEALSRGAASATFVDNSEVSLTAVKKNIEAAGFSEQSRTVRSDFAAFASGCRERFDLAFLDPPYADGLLEPAICAVVPLMSDHGTIVCEHPGEVSPPEKVGAFCLLRRYRYGKVFVSVYRKGETDE